MSVCIYIEKHATKCTECYQSIIAKNARISELKNLVMEQRDMIQKYHDRDNIAHEVGIVDVLRKSREVVK